MYTVMMLVGPKSLLMRTSTVTLNDLTLLSYTRNTVLEITTLNLIHIVRNSHINVLDVYR